MSGFSDSSSYGWTVNPTAASGGGSSAPAPTIDTSDPYLGSGSMGIQDQPYTGFAHGASAHVPYGSGSALDIFTLPAWTIEFSVRSTDSANGAIVIAYGDTDTGTPPTGQLIISVADVGGGMWSASVNDYSAFGTGVTVSGTFPQVSGDWMTIAIVKEFDGPINMRIFANGNLIASGGNYESSGYAYSGALCVNIGQCYEVSGGWAACNYDEIRVSNIARYTSNYTPSPVEFANDSHTMLLLHFDTADTIVVPDVVNTSASGTAQGIIEAAGLTVGTITYAPDVIIIDGNVSIQSPAAGAFAAPGDPVNLIVSTGRAGLLVPNLIDLDQTDADALLASVGLLTGAVSSAPSLVVPVGEVLAQNPQAGTPVAYGSNVSYILSLGIPVAPSTFDFEATVISQYANSPTILQLVESMNGYIDQTQNFSNFYNFVWNVDTAEGFGLDIWGKIVNVSRLLHIPTGQRYVGFQDGTGPSWDVEPFGEGGVMGTGGKGVWYTRVAATQTYLLEDEPYRQLILTKALANIVNTTVPAFNRLLQNLFPGRGNPYVFTSGVMEMTFHFDFALTPIELAILQQSGAFPVPPGVSVVIVVPP